MASFKRDSDAFALRRSLQSVWGHRVLLSIAVPAALFFGVREGVKKAVPTTFSNLLGSKAEAQALVKDIASEQITRVTQSSDPSEAQDFRNQLLDVILSETRDGARQVIGRIQLKDDPAFAARLLDVVVTETRDGTRRVIGNIDVNEMLAGSTADPETTRLLLAPLAAELPRIVAGQLDVNALLSNTTGGDPEASRAFNVAFAKGLAEEVGKDVDFGPILNEWLLELFAKAFESGSVRLPPAVAVAAAPTPAPPAAPAVQPAAVAAQPPPQTDAPVPSALPTQDAFLWLQQRATAFRQAASSPPPSAAP